MSVLPRKARLWLLKFALGSAEGVTNDLASVCRGILLESDNRACREASFADWRARSGDGEGNGLRESSKDRLSTSS